MSIPNKSINSNTYLDLYERITTPYDEVIDNLISTPIIPPKVIYSQSGRYYRDWIHDNNFTYSSSGRTVDEHGNPTYLTLGCSKKTF